MYVYRQTGGTFSFSSGQDFSTPFLISINDFNNNNNNNNNTVV